MLCYDDNRRQQGPDTEDVFDDCCFSVKYGKNIGKWLAYAATNQRKISNVSEYINIVEIVDRIFTSSEHDKTITFCKYFIIISTERHREKVRDKKQRQRAKHSPEKKKQSNIAAKD